MDYFGKIVLKVYFDSERIIVQVLLILSRRENLKNLVIYTTNVFLNYSLLDCSKFLCENKYGNIEIILSKKNILFQAEIYTNFLVCILWVFLLNGP